MYIVLCHNGAMQPGSGPGRGMHAQFDGVLVRSNMRSGTYAELQQDVSKQPCNQQPELDLQQPGRAPAAAHLQTSSCQHVALQPSLERCMDTSHLRDPCCT